MLDEQEIELVRNKLSSVKWIDSFDIIKTNEAVYLLILAEDKGETIEIEDLEGGFESVPLNISRTLQLLEELSEMVGIDKIEGGSLGTHLLSSVEEFLDVREDLLKSK